MSFAERLESPSSRHLFGTDEFGRDVLSRVLSGAKYSLFVGLVVTIVSQVGGIIVGVAAGYYERVDKVLMRAMDGLMAIPEVVLAMGVLAALGPGLTNAIIAISAVQLPRGARIVRASVLQVKVLDFVDAARSLGASEFRILTRHVLRNSFAPILINASFVFATAVHVEAVLSFLGLGAAPPLPTWGSMLSDARGYIREANWYIFFPGMALAITVLGLNMLGDGIRDALDPRMR
jgi:peptide/nickel transport system permease protein